MKIEWQSKATKRRKSNTDKHSLEDDLLYNCYQTTLGNGCLVLKNCWLDQDENCFLSRVELFWRRKKIIIIADEIGLENLEE